MLEASPNSLMEDTLMIDAPLDESIPNTEGRQARLANNRSVRRGRFVTRDSRRNRRGLRAARQARLTSTTTTTTSTTASASRTTTRTRPTINSGHFHRVVAAAIEFNNTLRIRPHHPPTGSTSTPAFTAATAASALASPSSSFTSNLTSEQFAYPYGQLTLTRMGDAGEGTTSSPTWKFTQ